jgi:Ca2+-binding RTX toxin-like protein
MAVVNGTSEADVLLGTDSNDQLYGMESDDVLIASAGSDVLDGGEGFDTATYYAMTSGIQVGFGDAGATITGLEGKIDTLIGVEKVFGTFHNDTFASSVGGVTLEGSAGDDLYIVDSEGVTIIEEDYLGHDELRTSLSAIKMDPFIEKLTFTGTGDFKAYGNASDNEIIGGAGNDWLWGGDGADHFVGGEGFDTVSYSDSLEGVRVEDFTNYDGLTIAYGDTFTGIEAIQGSGFDDVIYRHQGSMIIDGADGYDTVSYHYAFDTANVVIGSGINTAGDTLSNVEKIIGTSGADCFVVNASGVTVAGGEGDDVYTVNSAGVTIEEDSSFRGGTDQVYTTLAELRLSAFIENLTYTGSADFIGYGNDESNTIVSGAGNDVLLGGAGSDRFEGGAGIDIVSYDDSSEGLSASLKWGAQSGIAFQDVYIDIEGLRGSQFNDVLEGEWGDNVLEGGAGDDQIVGGEGNDQIYGGLASGLDAAGQSDTLFGGAGDDVIVAAHDSLFTWVSGDEGHDTLTLGRGVAYGGQGNDRLIFNAAGQSGDGGSGFGEQGDDTYVVNTSALVTIKDEGLDLNDTLILNMIADASQLSVTRVGDDIYLHSANDGNSGVPDNGVKLVDWYAGFDTLEHIRTADGQVYDLPVGGDGFAMFG